MEQSENIININLDSQRNIMLRISLQLEMGMFSVTVCGLIGVAFGMNLDSSLENVSLILTMIMTITSLSRMYMHSGW